MKRIPGDYLFVRYKPKNELGLIKKNAPGDSFFVWYHMGGTTQKTRLQDLEFFFDPSDILTTPFSNDYTKPSLFERFLRAIENPDHPSLSDLIDTLDDTRPNVTAQFVITYTDKTLHGYQYPGMMLLEPKDIQAAIQDIDESFIGIYRLYDDNSEGLVESREDFLAHYKAGGQFGIEITRD